MNKVYLSFSMVGKLTLVILIYFLITDCKKEVELPQVVTYDITNITPLSATLNGSLVSAGSVSIDFRGVCWDTTPNPVMVGSSGPNINFIWAGTNPPPGDFSYDIQVFKPATKYYVRSMVRYYYGNYGTNGILYGNEVSFTTPGLYLGTSFWDGTVFSIDNTGEHGLLASLNDLENAAWYNGEYILTNASNSSDGQINSVFIMNAQGDSLTDYFHAINNTSNYAAVNCVKYLPCTCGYVFGITPWFLPSKDQLNLLYQNKDKIGSISNQTYWSSTESDAHLAWGQDFSNGTQTPMDKSQMLGVRAIRAF